MPDVFYTKNGCHSLIANTAGHAFLLVGMAAKNKKHIELKDEKKVDKNVGYLTPLGNLTVEKSLMF